MAVSQQSPMRNRHPKIFYVGGLLSLVCLPILLIVRTTDARKNAIEYGSIQVDISRGGSSLYRQPDTVYQLLGDTETDKLRHLNQFCAQMKSRSDTIQRLLLPPKCTYGFFIELINTLRDNHFACGVEDNIVRFAYRPDMPFQQEYAPLTASATGKGWLATQGVRAVSALWPGLLQ